MSNTEKKYHRKEIATEQLKTAINLFLSNKDLSSVITLASAAANILDQLVRNSGKEPFLDYACVVHNELKGSTPPRKKYNHHIDKTLGIIAHKHMSDTCPETVTLNLFDCALGSLKRAVFDYVTLYGQDEVLIRKFLNWAWQNEGVKILEARKNMPERLRRKYCE